MRSRLEKLTKKLYKSVGIIILACATIAGWGGLFYYTNPPNREELKKELIGVPIRVDLTSNMGLFGGSFYLSGVLKDEYGKIISFGYPAPNAVCGAEMSRAYSLIQTEINDGDNETIRLRTTYNPQYNKFTIYVTANKETIKF